MMGKQHNTIPNEPQEVPQQPGQPGSEFNQTEV